MQVFKNNCLSNKKILISGASSGIGADSAYQFSQCGARLILLGRNRNKLEKVLSTLINPNDHTIIVSNLSEDDSAYKAIKSLKNNQLPLDGIFHAAGKELIKPVNLIKQEDIKEVFSSSIYAALSFSRSLLKDEIINKGGSVIFMSSIAAISGNYGLSVYSSSKSAISGLVKSLAIELSKRSIRVNSIVAGAVESPMHDRILKNISTKSAKDYELNHPLGFGKTADISNLALFLMSDASKWITGSEIVIDGGYTAK